MADTTQDAGSSLDLVDIKEIKENTVIGNDGGLRQILMIGGVNFALKSEADQNIITQAYQNFLNGIDFPLQIVIHSRKVNIEKYVQDLLARKNIEPSPVIQNQIEEYAQFIKGFVEKNAIMEKMFFMVVPFYPISAMPKGSGGMFSFLKRGKPSDVAVAKSVEDEAKLFHEHVEQLNERVEQVTTGLAGIGLDVTVLNDEQLTELFYNFYNPQTIERKSIEEAAKK